ncbi:uncharacterized protein LOC135924832 isoform X2 [Gordionus sp. m RMFG-2023]|uniref:uncharacterized protein LOC135924832 isoform X2 n=2 Tax=Gordionus sp. m RMFG-2023 TaxID=3053472 RepID=UPI0031FDBB3A
MSKRKSTFQRPIKMEAKDDKDFLKGAAKLINGLKIYDKTSKLNGKHLYSPSAKDGFIFQLKNSSLIVSPDDNQNGPIVDSNPDDMPENGLDNSPDHHLVNGYDDAKRQISKKLKLGLSSEIKTNGYCDEEGLMPKGEQNDLEKFENQDENWGSLRNGNHVESEAYNNLPALNGPLGKDEMDQNTEDFEETKLKTLLMASPERDAQLNGHHDEKDTVAGKENHNGFLNGIDGSTKHQETGYENDERKSIHKDYHSSTHLTPPPSLSIADYHPLAEEYLNPFSDRLKGDHFSTYNHLYQNFFADKNYRDFLNDGGHMVPKINEEETKIGQMFLKEKRNHGEKARDENKILNENKLSLNKDTITDTEMNGEESRGRIHADGDEIVGRPYSCNECGFSFTNKSNCDRHMRKKHGYLGKREIQNGQRLLSYLQQSATTGYRKEERKENQKIYCCLVCNETTSFLHHDSAIRHIVLKHPEVDNILSHISPGPEQIKNPPPPFSRSTTLSSSRDGDTDSPEAERKSENVFDRSFNGYNYSNNRNNNSALCNDYKASEDYFFPLIANHHSTNTNIGMADHKKLASPSLLCREGSYPTTKPNDLPLMPPYPAYLSTQGYPPHVSSTTPPSMNASPFYQGVNKHWLNKSASFKTAHSFKTTCPNKKTVIHPDNKEHIYPQSPNLLRDPPLPIGLSRNERDYFKFRDEEENDRDNVKEDNRSQEDEYSDSQASEGEPFLPLNNKEGEEPDDRLFYDKTAGAPSTDTDAPLDPSNPQTTNTPFFDPRAVPYCTPGPKKFVCVYCHNTYSSRGNVNRHIRNTHFKMKRATNPTATSVTSALTSLVSNVAHFPAVLNAKMEYTGNVNHLLLDTIAKNNGFDKLPSPHNNGKNDGSNQISATNPGALITPPPPSSFYYQHTPQALMEQYYRRYLAQHYQLSYHGNNAGTKLNHYHNGGPVLPPFPPSLDPTRAQQIFAADYEMKRKHNYDDHDNVKQEYELSYGNEAEEDTKKASPDQVEHLTNKEIANLGNNGILPSENEGDSDEQADKDDERRTPEMGSEQNHDTNDNDAKNKDTANVNKDSYQHFDGPENRLTTVPSFECSECGLVFAAMSSLNRHLCGKHGLENNKTIDKAGGGEDSDKMTISEDLDTRDLSDNLKEKNNEDKSGLLSNTTHTSPQFPFPTKINIPDGDNVNLSKEPEFFSLLSKAALPTYYKGLLQYAQHNNYGSTEYLNLKQQPIKTPPSHNNQSHPHINAHNTHNKNHHHNQINNSGNATSNNNGSGNHWICTICGTTFSLKHSLIRHHKRHSARSPQDPHNFSPLEDMLNYSTKYLGFRNPANSHQNPNNSKANFNPDTPKAFSETKGFNNTKAYNTSNKTGWARNSYEGGRMNHKAAMDLYKAMAAKEYYSQFFLPPPSFMTGGERDPEKATGKASIVIPSPPPLSFSST